MEVVRLSTSKRAYDASGRQAQARVTRIRVREAAATLFVAQGYAGTSIAAVAREAGVAPQTVYGAFGSKAQLLREVVEVALVGDDEPVAVADRPDAQRVIEAASATEAIDALASMCRQIFDRVAALLAVANVAAADEPEIAAMARGGAEGRLVDMRRTVTALAARDLLRAGITPAEAVDHVWAVTSPDLYLSFVRDRGWSVARYERWLRSALALVIG